MLHGRDALRTWVERSHYTQGEVARLIGITDVFLSQILHGHRMPGLATAIKVERLTGVPAGSWEETDVSGGAVAIGSGPRKRKG